MGYPPEIEDECKKAEEKFSKSKEELVSARNDRKSTENGYKLLFDFILRYATSLRKLHELEAHHSEKTDKKSRKLRTLEIPKLVIDSPDGPISIKNLFLRLKPIGVEENAGEVMVKPGIEHVSGEVEMRLPDGEDIHLNLNLDNIDVVLDAAFSKSLHEYITTTNQFKLFPQMVGIIKGILKTKAAHQTGKDKKEKVKDKKEKQADNIQSTEKDKKKAGPVIEAALNLQGVRLDYRQPDWKNSLKQQEVVSARIASGQLTASQASPLLKKVIAPVKLDQLSDKAEVSFDSVTCKVMQGKRELVGDTHQNMFDTVVTGEMDKVNVSNSGGVNRAIASI